MISGLLSSDSDYKEGTGSVSGDPFFARIWRRAGFVHSVTGLALLCAALPVVAQVPAPQASSSHKLRPQCRKRRIPLRKLWCPARRDTLPIFNRNQGEIARTYYALTQSQFLEKAAEQQAMTDVKNAYEILLNSQEIVQLNNGGYLQQAQQSLDIAQFSYQHGAASLLDFLDAERSYRSTELSYRQALASYLTAQEQLREAVGTRDLQ